MKCFFCEREAIAKNSSGVAACKYCKNKAVDDVCPVCSEPMDIRGGKYGAFFHCWRCSKNWSAAKISSFREDSGHWNVNKCKLKA